MNAAAIQFLMLAGVLAASLGGGIAVHRASGGDDSSQTACGPAPDIPYARTQDEWIALIEHGKCISEDPNAPWPEPMFGPGVNVVYSCSEVPATARVSQGAYETSPDGSKRRMTMSYFDAATNASIALVIRSDQIPADCVDKFGEWAEWEDPHSKAVDQHICEQAERMAASDTPTDVTLAVMPPRVARAYLEAYCRGE